MMAYINQEYIIDVIHFDNTSSRYRGLLGQVVSDRFFDDILF